MSLLLIYCFINPRKQVLVNLFCFPIVTKGDEGEKFIVQRLLKLTWEFLLDWKQVNNKNGSKTNANGPQFMLVQPKMFQLYDAYSKAICIH